MLGLSLAGPAVAHRGLPRPILLTPANAPWSGSVLGWWDATDTATLIKDSNGNVSSWLNKGSAGGNAAATGNNPAYSATGGNNGSPALTFNATPLAISSTSGYSLGAADGWVCAVAATASGAAQYSKAIIYGQAQPGATREICGPIGNTNGFYSASNSIDANNKNPPTCLGTDRLVIGIYNSSGIITYTDGTQSDSISMSINTQSGPAYIGAGNGYSGQNFVGLVKECLVGSGVLTTAYRQQLEGYAAWHNGQQANLPSNHPYANSPPTL